MTTVPGALATGTELSADERVIDVRDLRMRYGPKDVLDGVTFTAEQIVLVGGMTLIGFLLQLVPGLFLVGGLHVDAGGWLTLLWLVPLAFVATMPLGAVFGSLFETPQGMGLIMLPMIGLVAISGIFYPITSMPGWLQGIAQVFPIYWLGLGMRSVFLPDALTAAELYHSWRHLEAFGVLSAWAILGLVIAPVILRRMARRESGSAVAARRERVLTSVPR